MGINLKSVLIGNGLSDPYTQYAYYRPMACGEGGHEAVLSESECQGMDDALPRCQSLIERCYDSGSAWSCVPATIYCNNAMMGPYQRSGRNVYDIRGPCEDSSNLCYPAMGWISEYLNQQDVRDAVGAEVDSYDSCNWLGNEAWTNQLEWPGHKDFAKAELKDLNLASSTEKSSNDEAYGKVKTSGNLTFMRIFEAGHMVPMDQPDASIDF